MDTDDLVLKSFDVLRRYAMVLGRESGGQLSNGVIIAEREAPFLSIWLEAYRSYRGREEGWGYLSTVVPHQLAALFPHLIHVEETSLNRPNWAVALFILLHKAVGILPSVARGGSHYFGQ